MCRRAFLTAVGAVGVTTGISSVGSRTTATTNTQTLLEGTARETTLYINDSGVDGVTSFVIGGIHGNEEAGYLAGDEIKRWTPRSGTLLVLPRANTVAIEQGTREANGDLNRQFPLNQPPITELARAIWGVVTEFVPDLLIDMHESAGRYIGERLGQSVGYPPQQDARVGSRVAIEAVNESIGATRNKFHTRSLPGPEESPNGVLVQRAAYDLGMPAYIIETYEDLDLSDRIRWQKELVRRLINYWAGLESN